MTEIAVAFDVPGLDEAIRLDERLGDGPELAKVGLELFTAAGPEAVTALRRRHRRVFLDLKLHDIPNTAKGAARAAARLGAELLTVHASGGSTMIAAAVEGAQEGVRLAIPRDRADTKVVAVTLLTSLDPARLPPGFQQPFDAGRVIAELASMAIAAGAHGIVCSAVDLPAITRQLGRSVFAVTPGIRPAGGASHDQARISTITDAVRAGSSVLVLGRAITASGDLPAALVAAREERDRAGATTAGMG